VHARSNTDAKGKKGVFQGEKRFFQREMLFFLLRAHHPSLDRSERCCGLENKGMSEMYFRMTKIRHGAMQQNFPI
jgi:hypothetical protein